MISAQVVVSQVTQSHRDFVLICKYCRKIFKGMSSLKSHKRSVHKEEMARRRRVEQDTADAHASESSLNSIGVKTEIGEMDVAVNGPYQEVIFWYKCQHCHILLETMTKFLDHQEGHKQNQPLSFLFTNSKGLVEIKDSKIFIPSVNLVPLETSCLKYQCEIYLPRIVLTRFDSAPTQILTEELNLSSGTRSLFFPKSELLSFGFDDGLDDKDFVVPCRNAQDDDHKDCTVPEDVEVNGKGQFVSERKFSVRSGSGSPLKCEALLLPIIPPIIDVAEKTTESGNQEPGLPIPKPRFICKLCCPFINFNYQPAYIFHLNSRHRVNDSYQCPYCPFNTKGRKTEINKIRRHITRSHSEISKTKFECEICVGKTFTEFSGYRSHISSTHFVNGVYVCPNTDCERKFNRFFGLNYHFKKKHQLTSYICSITTCGKTFLSRKQLEQHTERHNRFRLLTSKKQFKCPACQREFQEIQTLRRHFNVHLTNNPFVRKIYEQKASSRVNVQSHVRLHLGLPKLRRTCSDSRKKERRLRVKQFKIEEKMTKFRDKANDNLTRRTAKTKTNEAAAIAGGSRRERKIPDRMLVDIVNKMIKDVLTAGSVQPNYDLADDRGNPVYLGVLPTYR